MLRTYQSAVLDAPIDEVWERVSDFHDMSWASSVVTSCQSAGDKNCREVGAKRVLNEAIKETLRTFDENDRRLSYSIDDGPSPISRSDVSNYIGTIHLLPVTMGNQTFIEWYSEWESSSDEAVEFCNNVYVALLTDLAQSLK